MSLFENDLQVVSKKMDRIYWWQILFYDLTRKYYLLGRDRVLNDLKLTAETVCEIGCGTGRNLIYLAKHYPLAKLWGIDASSVMINRAKENIRRHNFNDRIHIDIGLAEKIESRAFFYNQEMKFDRLLFIYVLSMIEDPKDILDTALKRIKSGGLIHIIDFSDGKHLPNIIRRIHNRWLALFGVLHRTEVISYLKEQEKNGLGICKIEYSSYHYYEICTFRKN